MRLGPALAILRRGMLQYFRQGALIILCLLAAKILGLLAQARAAVYLGPESYGISGIFYGLAPIIVLLTNLRTDIVLVREYPNYTKAKILPRILSSIFSFRLLILILISVLAIPLIAHSPLLLACGLSTLPFYASQALKPYWLLQAKKNLHVHYIGMLVQTCITAACIFIFFREGQQTGSDLIAYSIGGSIALLTTWQLANKGMPSVCINKTTLVDVKEITIATKWILLTACFSVGYTAMELPLLALLSSNENAGIYRTAVTLSENLYTFLAFSNALLYPHLVQWKNISDAHLVKMQHRTLLIFGSIGMLIFTTIAILAPSLYHLLYQGDYNDAITPFRILVLSKMCMLLTGIYSWGLMAQKRDKTLLFILAPLSLLSIASSFYFIPKYGIIASAYISLGFSASFFALTFLNSQKIKP